jgi:hypothetical protein
MKCSLHERRPFLASAVLLALATAATAQEPAGQIRRVVLRVSEPAGIRRFGYPVSAVIPLPEAIRKTDRFRMLDGGKPVTAQFQPPEDDHRGFPAVLVDFNASPAPLESREYILEYGPDVAPGPKPQGGMRVERKDDEFRIIHSADLEFVVPADLRGLLARVRTSKMDYLRAGSAGLVLLGKDGNEFRLDGPGSKGQVVKEGPLAITLRFECKTALRDGKSVPSVVDLDFVSSKSWVKVTWKVDFPKGTGATLGADLNLNVDGEPNLVDFGADSTVYAQLRKGQSALLRQNPGDYLLRKIPAWEVLTGPTEGRLSPYVVATKSRFRSSGLGGTALDEHAEGWAHVMDKTRCTAVAMEHFFGGSEIRVDSDGRLCLSAGTGGKLSFWLHFVPMPVHVGAATSPQAMQAPLQVEIKKKP